MEPGELYVLSAPSGGGKTTLIGRLFERHRSLADTLAFSVSHTTRPPRQGEVEGRDYFFIGRDEFEAMIAAGRFLEWAVVFGRYYGTSLEAVEREKSRGNDVILDIDVQGARQVRRRFPATPSIFIMPPSFEVLETRLRGRGSDAPEQIERRLETALEEVREYRDYDYVILNQDLDLASEALAAVFLSRRSRRQRMQGQIERILDRFPSSEQLTLRAGDLAL